MKAKESNAADMLFPLRAAFIDWATGYTDEPKLASVLIMNLDLANSLILKLSGEIC